MEEKRHEKDMVTQQIRVSPIISNKLKDFKIRKHNPICRTEKETQMYRTDFWTLWEKVRVGWSERIALKHAYYQVWNRSPAQGCMRQVLGAGALGRPRGRGWRGRWKGRSGWGKHVNPWLTHLNVWQRPLQYCKVISLQLIKINEKKIKNKKIKTLKINKQIKVMDHQN